LQAVGPAVEDLVNASMEEQELTERLGDADLKHIVRMRLEGYSVRQIASEIGQDHATVCRKIRRIRSIWRQSGLES
jgi:IS30 family transposase